MPQNYEVQYSTNGVTYTTLTNVQEISVNIGRQRQLDAYNASSCSVTMRYPTGFASPITALTSGNYVRINNATTSKLIFKGVINNVDVRYGIPYAGGVGQADFLTFTGEGAFSRFGRVQGSNYAMAAGTLDNQIIACEFETGLSALVTPTAADKSFAATTISGTWADWVSSVLNTINGRLIDAEINDYITIVSPFDPAVATVNFSDTANNATNQVYDQVNFGSYADNYYTQIIVDPESFAPATVEVGSVPFRTLLVNTLNADTAQATDYANYLLANYDEQGAALLSISCLAAAQSVFKLDQLYTGGLVANYPGTQVNVTFRGTTFACIIEGVSMSATPEDSRYTFYLSGADLNAYLILNNTVFGRLDFNKLGY